MFLTFFGEARGNKHTHDHAHESPMTMLIPLGALAIGAVFAGMVWYGSFFGKTNYVAQFFGIPYAEEGHGDDHAEETHSEDALATEAMLEDDDSAEVVTDEAHGDEDLAEAAHADDGYAETHYVFTGAPGEGAIHHAPDNHVLNDAHSVPTWVKLAPFFAMLGGFLTAFMFYIVNPSLPGRLAQQQRPLYNFLLNKWYFDEAYDFIFVRPAQAIGRFLWHRGDRDTIDGGINGLAMGIIPFFTRLAGRAQSGYIFHYAFAMVLGLVVLITFVTLSAG